ncbi:MAG: hypothetical protein E4H11_05935, partial [Myxococcales bacterium]
MGPFESVEAARQAYEAVARGVSMDTPAARRAAVDFYRGPATGLRQLTVGQLGAPPGFFPDESAPRMVPGSARWEAAVESANAQTRQAAAVDRERRRIELDDEIENLEGSLEFASEEFTAAELAGAMEDEVHEFMRRPEFRLAAVNTQDRERMLEAMVTELGIEGGVRDPGLVTEIEEELAARRAERAALGAEEADPLVAGGQPLMPGVTIAGEILTNPTASYWLQQHLRAAMNRVDDLVALEDARELVRALQSDPQEPYTVADPTSWLARAYNSALDRDSVDALHDARSLVAALEERVATQAEADVFEGDWQGRDLAFDLRRRLDALALDRRGLALLLETSEPGDVTTPVSREEAAAELAQIDAAIVYYRNQAAAAHAQQQRYEAAQWSVFGDRRFAEIEYGPRWREALGPGARATRLSVDEVETLRRVMPGMDDPTAGERLIGARFVPDAEGTGFGTLYIAASQFENALGVLRDLAPERFGTPFARGFMSAEQVEQHYPAPGVRAISARIEELERERSNATLRDIWRRASSSMWALQGITPEEIAAERGADARAEFERVMGEPMQADQEAALARYAPEDHLRILRQWISNGRYIRGEITREQNLRETEQLGAWPAERAGRRPLFPGLPAWERAENLRTRIAELTAEAVEARRRGEISQNTADTLDANRWVLEAEILERQAQEASAQLQQIQSGPRTITEAFDREAARPPPPDTRARYRGVRVLPGGPRSVRAPAQIQALLRPYASAPASEIRAALEQELRESTENAAQVAAQEAIDSSHYGVEGGLAELRATLGDAIELAEDRAAEFRAVEIALLSRVEAIGDEPATSASIGLLRGHRRSREEATLNARNEEELEQRLRLQLAAVEAMTPADFETPPHPDLLAATEAMQ